ncbi:MAG: HPF/RaiA family ribosome-associated protein [Bacteroidota bacterium]|nr:HPF/RaiA family ribosome-associated protein [Bacteroidota bacterium]
MNIGFHAPQGEVKEWVIDHVRQKLMDLYHQDKGITKAQVYFREQPDDERNKICEIELMIYGDPLFVHRKAPSFEQASNEVLAELAEKVDEQIRNQGEPPEEITSTVKV